MTYLLLAALLAFQAPARDGAVPRIGTAGISGTVVTDDAVPPPLRRVKVTLQSGSLDVPQAVVTDDAGRFAFGAVAAGN